MTLNLPIIVLSHVLFSVNYKLYVKFRLINIYTLYYNRHSSLYTIIINTCNRCQSIFPFVFVEGNIFGCSLSVLVQKDAALTKERVHHVPLIFCKVCINLSLTSLSGTSLIRNILYRVLTCLSFAVIKRDRKTRIEGRRRSSGCRE